MKKRLMVLLLCCLMVSLAGCAAESEIGAEITGMTDNGDGTLSVVDTTNSPLDGGLAISVTQDTGMVDMVITDEEGNETDEYYLFNPTDDECLRHKYIAAMEAEYTYYYDLSDKEITMIYNSTGEDVTESTKEIGRYEAANIETGEQVNLLMAYFEDQYGVAIEDLAK